jgi:pre-mRNA-processing factor 19
LEKTREELAQALYQHDAACRVIARLIKERDHARSVASSTVESRIGKQTSMEEDDHVNFPSSLSMDISTMFVEKNKELSKQRKQKSNQIDKSKLALQGLFESSNIVKKNQLSGPFHLVSSNLHLNSHLLYQKSANHAVLVNVETEAVEKTFTLHSAQDSITSLLYLPSSDIVLFGTSSGNIEIWMSGQYRSTLKPSARPITSLLVCPLENFVFFHDSNDSWGIMLVDHVNCVIVLKQTLALGSKSTNIVSASIHVDGLLLAFGDSTGNIHIVDLRNPDGIITSLKHTASASNHGYVSNLQFSENGYTLASTNSASNQVLLWDLRKLTNEPGSILIDKSEGISAGAISFDNSAMYMTVIDSIGGLRVFHQAEKNRWETQKTICEMVELTDVILSPTSIMLVKENEVCLWKS